MKNPLHTEELVETVRRLRVGHMLVPPAADQFPTNKDKHVDAFLTLFFQWNPDNCPDVADALAASELERLTCDMNRQARLEAMTRMSWVIRRVQQMAAPAVMHMLSRVPVRNDVSIMSRVVDYAYNNELDDDPYALMQSLDPLSLVWLENGLEMATNPDHLSSIKFAHPLLFEQTQPVARSQMDVNFRLPHLYMVCDLATILSVNVVQL